MGEIIDPRPHAVGSIRETCAANPHLQRVLPAMGYSREQRAELKATIEASGAELVLNASPADIGRLLDLALPGVQVRYRFPGREGGDIVAAPSVGMYADVLREGETEPPEEIKALWAEYLKVDAILAETIRAGRTPNEIAEDYTKRFEEAGIIVRDNTQELKRVIVTT